MTCGYPNISKFLDNAGNKDSKVTGKMKTGLAPGKIIDGKLIRRGTWWPNIAQAVSTQTKYPEAAYLLLQWANSPSIFTWMVGNPAGYYDPFQLSDWKDPVVVDSYHQYGVDNLQQHHRSLGAVRQHERQQRLHDLAGATTSRPWPPARRPPRRP